MNDYGVRTTKKEQEAFPYDDYPLLNFSGTYKVTLMDKCWGKHINIICAFKTENGQTFRISILRRRSDDLYGPPNSIANFATAPLGSKWLCTFVKKGDFFNMTDAIPDH